MEVAKDSVAMQRQLAASKEDEMVAALEKAGMTVNRDVNSAAFQAATKSAWTGFIAANGQGIIDAILAASKP
jgi:TRAP-type C4-dicarboxylate transport system substrate-binding protein